MIFLVKLFENKIVYLSGSIFEDINSGLHGLWCEPVQGSESNEEIIIMFHTCLRSIFNNFPLNTYVMSRVLPEMLFAWVPSSQTTLQWERILLNWKITIRFQFQFNDISDGNFGTIDLIWCISLGILNTEDKSWSLSFFRIKMFQCFPTEIIFLNFVDKVILLEKLNNWLSNKQNSILPVHTTLTLQSSIIILQQSVNFLLEIILTTNNFEN